MFATPYIKALLLLCAFLTQGYEFSIQAQIMQIADEIKRSRRYSYFPPQLSSIFSYMSVPGLP
jgi:hypothetical protein